VLINCVRIARSLGHTGREYEVPIFEYQHLVGVGVAASDGRYIEQVVCVSPERVNVIFAQIVVGVVGTSQRHIEDIVQVQIRLPQHKSPVAEVGLKEIHGS
jgi:hypothetical protein